MKRLMGILVVMITALVLSGPFTLVKAAETQTKAGTKQAVRININTATADALTELKGIGPKKAESIVAFRTEHGPFKKLEDIMLVKGIGQKLFSKIKDQITIQ